MLYPVVFSETIKHATSNHGYMIDARYVHKEKEADKVAVVVEADAIIHPWTVMV